MLNYRNYNCLILNIYQLNIFCILIKYCIQYYNVNIIEFKFKSNLNEIIYIIIYELIICYDTNGYCNIIFYI